MKKLQLIWAAVTPKQLKHRFVAAKNIAFLFFERKRVGRKGGARAVGRRAVPKGGKVHNMMSSAVSEKNETGCRSLCSPAARF